MLRIFTRNIIVTLIVIVTLLSAAIPISTAQDATIIPLRITIVFDNTIYEGDMRAAWGFAAIIERGDHTLLFDSGPNGTMLLHNMEELGFDPLAIDAVVLSHEHGDHTDGMITFLKTEARPPVYILPSFPRTLKTRLGNKVELIEVTPGQEIVPGIFTTGEMYNNSTREQSLVIPTDDGLVVITGCAHPGIVEIVAEAKSLLDAADQPVVLAMGGFHLMEKNEQQIEAITEDLRDLGVQRVMPTHCTGDAAIAHFAAVLGEDYLEGGIGRAIEFEIATEDTPASDT